MASVLKEHPCEVRRHIHNKDAMLLCDVCSKGYQMECLDPPLVVMPAGDKMCVGIRQGSTVE